MKLLPPVYYYCIVLLLLINKGTAQTNYTFRWYSSDNGELPQSSVKGIVRDKYDFIWLSTENGIVRYDGSEFSVFNSATTELEGSRFTEILGNPKKDSLYAYNEGNKELVVINQRKIHISRNKTFDNSIIKNGKLFINHGGLPSIRTQFDYAPFYINLTNNKKYFINTREIEFCDSKMKSIYKIPYKSKSIFNFFVLDDTLYYLKENGEYNWVFQNRIQSGKLDSSIKKKFKIYWNLAAKQVFLCSENKIYLLTFQKNKLSTRFIADFKNFNNSNISSILYDGDNQRLYLGSQTDGLCILSFSSLNVVKKKTQKTEVYYSSLPFNDNSIITDDGLILNNEKVIDSIPVEDTDYSSDKIAMTRDANGGIWLTRKKGLYCYLKDSNYKKYIKYEFKQEIKTLYKDSNNTIWISLQQDAFNSPKLYSISEKKKELKLALVLNTNINYIIEGENKTLYLGAEKGIFKYELTNNKLFFIKKTQKINTRSIFIDSDKKIWITTYEKGFYLYSNNILYSFPKDKNNYLCSSHCIVEDKKGYFWITTNKGLFQVSKQSLLQYIENKKHSIYYHYYDRKDGFITNEFNGGCQPCANYLKNDYITFPSMNGMVFLNANEITPILPNKDLFVDKAIVDQKIIYFKDTIVLNNNFQRVKFLIDCSYYGNINNLNIEAKLNDVENSNWEKIGSDKFISFTNLPPGNYTLTIRNLADFSSNYKYKKITLIVPPTFYQTFWFKATSYLLGVILIILLWQLRFYYMKTKNEKLERIIRARTHKLARTIKRLKTSKDNLRQEISQEKRLVKTISHDIKSPLKYLTLTVQHLYDKIENQNDENLKEEAKSLYISSFQLYAYVENLVKYSSIFSEGKKLEDKNYLLHELVNTKIQLFEKMAMSENTIIINNISESEYLKTNNKILSIIIHNLLDNAIKNTRNGAVEFVSEKKDNKLLICIKDNGKGMKKEMIDYYMGLFKKQYINKLALRNYGIGLHMVIELILLIEGELQIKSDINKGTTIEIIVDYI